MNAHHYLHQKLSFFLEYQWAGQISWFFPLPEPERATWKNNQLFVSNFLFVSCELHWKLIWFGWNTYMCIHIIRLFILLFFINYNATNFFSDRSSKKPTSDSSIYKFLRIFNAQINIWAFMIWKACGWNYFQRLKVSADTGLKINYSSATNF